MIRFKPRSAPSHTVRLEAVGGTFRVFLNKVFVAEFTDDTLAAPGLFAFCMYHHGDQAATVFFDNFRIYEPGVSPRKPP